MLRHCWVWLKLHSHWPGTDPRWHSQRWPHLKDHRGVSRVTEREEVDRRKTELTVAPPLLNFFFLFLHWLTVLPGHTSHSRGLWQTNRTDSPGGLHILPLDASLPENDKELTISTRRQIFLGELGKYEFFSWTFLNNNVKLQPSLWHETLQNDF